MTTNLNEKALAFTLDAEGMQKYVSSAIDDLTTAIEEYPRLSVFLTLARLGLVAAVQRAEAETSAWRKFFGLRGAASIAAGTLEDVRKRNPDLENTSSLICDVAYGLADLAKMRPSADVQ